MMEVAGVSEHVAIQYAWWCFAVRLPHQITPRACLAHAWGRYRSKEVEERLQAAVASARAAAKASHTGKMVSRQCTSQP